jgi:hypothetical protein
MKLCKYIFIFVIFYFLFCLFEGLYIFGVYFKEERKGGEIRIRFEERWGKE